MHNRSGSQYCSIVCSRAGRFTYTKQEILNNIQLKYKELGRVPAKRELKKISDKSINIFGSWNKTIEAAGLTPYRSHDHQMYRRTRTKARDGHICDSISEAIVDNWLTEHNIQHERDARYPTTNHRADWCVGDIFIEYFGLAQDSPRYDRSIKEKQKLCKESGVKLVEIYPSDLYPRVALDGKLATLVRNNKLAEELEKERKMFEAGKGKLLRSLRDLR